MCIKSPCYTGHVLFANNFKRKNYFNVLCKLTITLTLFKSESDYVQWSIPML